MPNPIRIKRRASGGAVGAPTGLKNAELAYNEADSTLYIGVGISTGDNAASSQAIGGAGAYVGLTGAQTVAGAKTFSSTIIGSVNGNAGTATTLQTARDIALGTDLSGSVSFNGSANVTIASTIAAGAVTNAKMANMATSTLKGRVTAGTGVAEDLTAAQVRTLLNVQDGAQVNQNAFGNVVVGATTIASTVVSDSLNFTAGPGVSISGNSGTKAVTISSTWNTSARSANYTAIAADNTQTQRFTGTGPFTLTLTAAATVGNSWSIYVRNDTSNNLTISPASGTINGLASVVLSRASGCLIISNGTEFYTMGDNQVFVNGTGMTVKQADGSFAIRSLATASTGRITVTNADGGAGNPTVDLALSGVTAGTYTKLTVDTYGRVTAGATLIAADIPSLTAASISNFTAAVQNIAINTFTTAPTGPLSMNSQRITNLADPTGAQDAATKNYVDSVASGVDVRASVRVATAAPLPTNVFTTTNGGTITMSAVGILTVDGVNTVLGNRILVKDQATASQNGIYVVTTEGTAGVAAILRRSDDANTAAMLSPGTFVFVEAGTTNADAGWVMTQDGAITLNTTNITWAQFSGTGQVIDGVGLDKNGNTLSVLTVNASRITVGVTGIDLATTAITPGTYRSLTIDAYGRATAGTNPTTLSGYGITDAVANTVQVIASTGLAGGGALSGNVTMTLAGQALAFHNLGSNGMVARTGAGTVAARSVTGTTNRLAVTNGDGVSGNPTIDIDSAYVGQSSITTLGTIATGVWQGSAIALGFGGTGSNLSALSNGAIYMKSGTGTVAAVAGTDYHDTNSTIDGGSF